MLFITDCVFVINHSVKTRFLQPAPRGDRPLPSKKPYGELASALLKEVNRIVLGKNPMASAQSSHEEPFLGLGDLPLMMFQGFLGCPFHVYSGTTFCCAECGFYFLSTLLSIPTNDPADPAICPIFLWKSLTTDGDSRDLSLNPSIDLTVS